MKLVLSLPAAAAAVLSASLDDGALPSSVRAVPDRVARVASARFATAERDGESWLRVAAAGDDDALRGTRQVHGGEDGAPRDDGTPVKCGQVIKLLNLDTGSDIDEFGFESSSSEDDDRRVVCWGGETSDGERHWLREGQVRLRSVSTSVEFPRSLTDSQDAMKKSRTTDLSSAIWTGMCVLLPLSAFWLGGRFLKRARLHAFDRRTGSFDTASSDAQIPSSPPGSDDAPRCYICQEEGPHSGSGQPLTLNGCSCRNGNGCVHLSCAAGLARTKWMEINHRLMSGGGDGDPWWYWINCPVCLQYYTNDLAVDMASDLVDFVRDKFSETMHLQALHIRLRSLNSHEHWNIEQMKQTANDIITLAGRMEAAVEIKARLRAEADASATLGLLAVREGTQQSISLALEYFDKSRDAYKELGDESAILINELNIYNAKSRFGRDDWMTREELTKWETLFKALSESRGKGDPEIIVAGAYLVRAYAKAGRAEEVNDLLKELTSEARRIHGKSHHLTKYMQSLQEKISI